MNYDQILNRKGFEETLVKGGYSSEQVEVEWVKLVRQFEVSCALGIYDLLSELDQKKLSGGLKMDTEEGAREFFGRMNDFLGENPRMVDDEKVRSVVDKSAGEAYNYYLAFLKKEVEDDVNEKP